MAQVLNPKPGHVEFVVDNMAPDRFLSKYSGLPCLYNSSSALYSFIHLSPMLYNQ